MITINPIDVILWTLRRNERDVVNLYSTLSPVMQLASGGSMLNFGMWSEKCNEPLMAQNNLCSFFGTMSELNTAKHVVDVGSGLAAPATLWQNQYPDLNICCVNINHKQLVHSKSQTRAALLNSSSTKLPLMDNSADRVLALESAQHFKPFDDFLAESKRILKKTGLLCMAIPVTRKTSSFKNLGILKFTWSSEHYSLEYVKDSVMSSGFKILHESLIGSSVYDPLANYYIQNRSTLKKLILKKYPPYVEAILYKSILKMLDASTKNAIDYVLLKCRPM